MNRFTAMDRGLIRLEDPDASVRLAAVQEARTQDQTEVENRLRGLAIHDPNASVRLAALETLITFPGDHVAGTLRRALKDWDVVIRRLAAEALADYADDETVLALVAQVNDAHQVAETVLRSLARIATPSALLHLCERAESWGWPRQLEAISALGETRNASAVPTLAALLNADEIPIRAAAVKALGIIGQSAGFDGAGAILVDTLVGSVADPASNVRLSAIEALRHSNAWEGYPALNAALGDDSAGVRSAAEAALTHLQAPTHTRMAVRALAYRWPLLRIGALRRLESLADRTSCFAIAACLGDEDAGVRDTARVALRRLGWDPQQPDFHEALNSDIARLRAGSIRNLTERRDQESVPSFLKALQDSDLEVCGAAVIALGDLRVDDACPALCELLTDPDPILREAAIESLGKLGCRRALPALRERYKTFGGEPDGRLRQLLRDAIHAIEERTEQHAHLPLAASPPDPESDDLPLTASAPSPPDGR